MVFYIFNFTQRGFDYGILCDPFSHSFSNYRHIDIDDSKELCCLKKLCEESKKMGYVFI